MKIKTVILFALTIFMVYIASTNEAVTSTEHLQKPIKNSFESIGEATIYQTVAVDLNATFAEELAYELFGLNGSITIQSDKYVIENGSRTFELYRDCGSIWYTDSNKYWNVTYDPTLPSQSSCETIANTFINSSDYFEKPDALLTTFGDTNATAYNVETREIISKLLNIEVNFGFEIDDIPLGGPGGSCSVSIGDGGEIIAFNWVKRKFVPLQNEPIISLQDLLLSYGIEGYDEINSKLIYYQEAAGDLQRYLYPVYEVEIIKTLPISGQIISYIKHIPATPFNPKVEIVHPVDFNTFTPESNIFFNCTIGDGTGLFEYEWESNINGFLNDSKSFSTDSLSIATKENTTISHTITVTVTDANGLTATDSMIITIIRSSGIGVEYLLLLSFLSLGLIFFFRNKKREKLRISILVFLMIVNFSLTAFFNIASVSAEEDIIKYNFQVHDFEDDNILEVGVEYCTYPGTSDYIWQAKPAATKFYNKFESLPDWEQKFLFSDDAAWEQDFKWELGKDGGTDTYYIDAVDLALYVGHGNGNGFSFHSNCKFDDNWLHRSEAKWGDGDLDWILLEACKVLAPKFDDTYDTPNNVLQTKDVFERWGHALKGVRMICGWRTNGPAYVNKPAKCFNYMLEGKTIKNSWFKACKHYADDNFRTACFYGSPSDDPWNPWASDPINDCFPGFSFPYVDVVPKWWVYLTAQC